MNSTQDKSARIRTFCSTAAVVPVLVVNDPASARPLADALVAGGLPILEVTLRTEAALECIREMAQGDGVVGAGTVMTPRDVEAAVAAGARFAVSPGATDTLLDAAEDAGLPLLPGAATASEVMRLWERGYSMQKFFPAEASGGVTALKNLAGPLPQVSFCPTGGGLDGKRQGLSVTAQRGLCRRIVGGAGRRGRRRRLDAHRDAGPRGSGARHGVAPGRPHRH